MNKYFKTGFTTVCFGLAGFLAIRISLQVAVEQELWGLGAIVAFLLFFLPAFLLWNTHKKWFVYGFLIMGMAVAVYLRVPSIKFFYKILPLVLSAVLGFLSGVFWLYAQPKSRFIAPAVLFVFPLALLLNLYSLWVHKIEFGNFYGEVEKVETIPFAFKNKEGQVLTNETEKGKVVLFDFWFIGCPPCWVKFPELEALYLKYQKDPRVVIYAVNRPMKQDKPGRLFTAIEEKGHHFPVLAGTQEGMDAFGVYVYPTVVLLNANGEVVYMGEIENADAQIKGLLK